MARPFRSLANTIQHYRTCNAEALTAAARDLDGQTQADFTLTTFTNSTLDAWEAQWLPVSTREPPDGGWHWRDIKALYLKDYKRLEVAVFCGDRLCGMAIGTINNTAVVLEAVEGDPRDDSPLSGEVLLIVLQAFYRYAARTGRSQVWVMEPNPAVIGIYQEVFGFSKIEISQDRRPYCRKRVA